MLSPEKVLKALRLTEKSNRASSELNQYTFQVTTDANKHQIAEAVEHQFKVTVARGSGRGPPGAPR